MFAIKTLSCRFTAGLLPVLALVSAFPGCHSQRSDSEQAAVERLNDTSVRLSKEAIDNIKLTKAEVAEFPDQLSVMGRISVTEDRTTVVPSRVSGRTDGVYVASGEMVTKGQRLASIFSADFAIAREEYQQAIAQAQSGTDDGKKLLELSRRKLINMGVSESDFAEVARHESLDKEKAALTVRAPRSGALLTKNATIGNFVNTGDTLFTIGDLSTVWFAGDIYPEDLPKVHKAQEVVIESATGKPILGKVSFISPMIDPTSRTIKIRALMSNPGNELRADMYVKGSLTLSKATGLVIPASAIIRLLDKTFVFKRQANGVFAKTPIELVKEQNGTALVKSGISAGEEIVSEGGLLLDAALTTSEH